jgi:septum site-determining protein MinC
MSRIVSRPVRSGQQIYAAGTDLIVLAAVNPGAVVLADGSIHVYGPLRGRALAGIGGQVEARIFCRSLEAEVIAIAGVYRVLEEPDAQFAGQQVQVYLSQGSLMIESV